MPVSLSIHTHADHLDMYGEPDPTSAYSLSGHISVSLSSPSSFFDRRRTARYLLQSVSLTFEGQSEIYTPATGYSAFRLCSINHELVPSDEAIELSNENYEDSREPCVWNMIFNITVPGWLPESSVIGVEELGVRYGLYATARFLDLETSRGSWAFTTFCAPFLSKSKTAQTQQIVQLRRFLTSPTFDAPVFNTVSYLVNNPTISPKDENVKKRIPQEILAKIQTILSVPEYVDMSKDQLDVTLRMRSDGLEQEECQRIQLIDVSLSLTQTEKCRNQPSTNYQNKYPLPPSDQQPPNEPLIDPSPIVGIYDVGILPLCDRRDLVSRSFSLLPPCGKGVYHFGEDGEHVFANDSATSQSGDVTWHVTELTVPFADGAKINDDWDISATLRPSASMPLFAVYHEVNVTLTCAYTFPDSEDVVQEKLSFAVPVKLGKLAPPPPQPPLLPCVARSRTPQNTYSPRLPVVEPYATSLPVYSQLYDANGERKVDYSVPLPLYTPPSSGRRISVVEVVDVPLDNIQTRTKGDRMSLAVEEDEAEEDTPLLGTSTI